MGKLVTQVSMGGGELAPYVHGRSDLSKFKIGAALLHNMNVRSQGGIYNSPGSKFVDYTYSDTGAYKKTKFVPFDADDNDTLCLMFSDNVLWFVRTGALVKFVGTVVAAGRAGAYSETAGVAAGIMALATPWPEADVSKIKFSQSNDIMTITVEGYDSYELRRYGYYDWGLFLLDTTPKIAAPASVAATPTVDLTVPSGVAAPTIYNRTYYYVVSAINEEGAESLASTADDALNDLSWRGNYNTITWAAVTGAVKYNVYKAGNSVYGYIGSTTELTFKDDNITANLSDTPKTGRNPFSASDRKPSVVEFHQQRRWFANYVAAPQSFDASGSGSYSDFNVSSPAKEDDAISGTIAARRRQAIYWFVPLSELVVFTQAGEWKFVGGNGDGDTITPQSIDARPQSNYGCRKYIQPIVVGSRILFVQSLGNVIYDMGYEITENKYVADELTALAPHLFEGRTSIQWSYDNKNHLLWIVMSDGEMVCYTYHREHELWAATRHTTDGKYKDVLCIPEGDDIGTYFLVERSNTDGKYTCVERKEDRYQRDPMDFFFVHCGLSFDNPVAITNITSSGTDTIIHMSGAHGLTVGQEVIISDVGGFKLTINSDQFDRGMNSKFIISAINVSTFAIPFDQTLRGEGDGNYEFSAYRLMVTTISGLDHLKGSAVAVLGDGQVFEGLTVSSGGSITLPRACGRVHVGLPYVSEYESLDIETGIETTQGIVRKVNRVHVRVKDTRGIKAGSSRDNATEQAPRSYEDYDSPPLLMNGYVSVTCEAKLQPSGLVYIRQDYPLPCEILSVTPDVEFGSEN